MSTATDNPVARHETEPSIRLPAVALEAMYPDESIIWMQRGQGWRWPLIYTVPPVFFAACVAAMCWLVARYDPPLFALTVIMLFVAAPLWAFAALRPIIGPAYEFYILTDIRVLHCIDLVTRSTWSLCHQHSFGPDDLPITSISVWGRRDRGWIMLRSDFNASQIGFRFRLTAHPSSLVGVERPLEVAALIKSTLSLPFEIEDHTR